MDSVWSPARRGFIGGRLAGRLLGEGHRVRCLVRASSDTSSLEDLDVEIAVGDLGEPASLAQADGGLPPRVPLRRAGLRLGDGAGDRPRQRRGHAEPAGGLRRAPRCGGSFTSARPMCTAIPARAESARATRRGAFATGTPRRSWMPRRRSAARKRRAQLDSRDPAPGDRLRAGLQGRDRRDRARDPRRAHAPDRRRPGDRRPLLRREPDRCSAARTRPRRRAGRGVQRERRRRGHVEGVRRRPGAGDSAARRVRWSLPYRARRAPSGSRSSTDTGCCAAPPASARRRCSPARRCRCSDAARTSATASCARRSAGSRGSTTRPASRGRSTGSCATTFRHLRITSEG